MIVITCPDFYESVKRIMARTYRHPARAPFTVRARPDRGWEDCDLPNGEPGWCVYLQDCDKLGLPSNYLTVEAINEIRAWLADTLGMSKHDIDDNVYAWGVTFEHEDQAFLCFLNYKAGSHVES